MINQGDVSIRPWASYSFDQNELYMAALWLALDVFLSSVPLFDLYCGWLTVVQEVEKKKSVPMLLYLPVLDGLKYNQRVHEVRKSIIALIYHCMFSLGNTF